MNVEQNSIGLQVLKYLLLPVSLIFYLVLFIRDLLYYVQVFSSTHLGLPTISIGNIVAGGTGKSPMVIFLCQELEKINKTAAILTRGYKSSLSSRQNVALKSGRIIHMKDIASDLNEGSLHADEALMQSNILKNHFVLVGANRKSSFLDYRAKNPGEKIDFCLLDDGFQHRPIRRDLDIVLLDYLKPFGSGFYLPTGELRVRKARLKDADVVIFTRAPNLEAPIPAVCQRLLIGKPVHNAIFRTKVGASLSLGKCYSVVANISQPERFVEDLRSMKVEIGRLWSKGDHVLLSKSDFAILKSEKAPVIVTQKDYYRQQQSFDLLGLEVIQAEIDVETNFDIGQYFPTKT